MTTRNAKFAKRQREQNLKDKSREREDRREERRARKGTGTAVDGVDPQIAGIVPGPQPPPEEE